MGNETNPEPESVLPDDNVKYQEAGLFFRHCSTLRRTTIGFIFAASAASLGFILGERPPFSGTTRLIAAVNIILCIGALLQELQLHAYQSRLAEYMRMREECHGPYLWTYPKVKKLWGTKYVMVLACALLILCWLLLLRAHPEKHMAEKEPSSNQSIRATE